MGSCVVKSELTALGEATRRKASRGFVCRGFGEVCEQKGVMTSLVLSLAAA